LFVTKNSLIQASDCCFNAQRVICIRLHKKLWLYYIMFSNNYPELNSYPIFYLHVSEAK